MLEGGDDRRQMSASLSNRHAQLERHRELVNVSDDDRVENTARALRNSESLRVCDEKSTGEERRQTSTALTHSETRYQKIYMSSEMNTARYLLILCII